MIAESKELISSSIGGLPVAPEFLSRYKRRRLFLERKCESYGKGEHREGNYRDLILTILTKNYYRWNAYQNRERLAGFEVYIADQARKLLEFKRDAEPVIVLDIGGMIGKSWFYIAKEFEEEVNNSRIAFVISNLFYSHDKDFENEMTRYTGGFEKMKERIRGARHLVHFVQGDASTLRRTKLELPDKTTVPLKGNVDLIHERFSLSHWSFIPELEVRQVESLLSQYGSYIIQRGDDTLTGSHGRPYGEREVREFGVKLAYRALQERLGLKKVTEVETGDFQGKEIVGCIIFRKPNAPLVEINK